MQREQQITQHNHLPFRNKIVFFIQYMFLGVIPALGIHIIYIYDKLPSNYIQAFYSISALIPNFIFVLTPFIENHTSLSYGKRKTWIVITNFLVAIFVWIASCFTASHQQFYLSILFIPVSIVLAFNKAAVDGFALKQYTQKSQMSFQQYTVAKLGSMFGGLFFIQLISPTLSSYFGKHEPFMTASGYLRLISLFSVILAIVTHFLAIQSIEQQQSIIIKRGFKQLLKQYKVFIDFNSIYCRMTLFFSVVYFGFQSFRTGYRIRLINELGFPKQSYVTLTTLIIILSAPISYVFSRKIQMSTVAWKMQLLLMLRLINNVVNYQFESLNIYIIFIQRFMGQIFMTLEALATKTLMNSISDVGLSGMLLAGANGIKVVLQNPSWVYIFIDVFGYDTCCVVGFIQQFFIIIYVGKFIQWILEGQCPKEITDQGTQIEIS